MLRKVLVSRNTLFECCRSSLSTKAGPLAGITVLDMTRILAGPTCTMVLADFGADVIKIEHPVTGDDTRQWAPFVGDVSCTFISLNRNKKSVGVDIKMAEGQHLLKQLAQKCDVLVENYVPGVLRKYGLDYESLHSVAPQLIYCSVTGFGPEGPYAQKPGVDLIAASMAGHLSMTGPADGEPCRTGLSVVDLMTGLRAHGAILAALYERRATGQGCKIDVDLFSTAVASLKNYAVSYLNAGIVPKRYGTEHVSVVPYKAFESKDGYITVGAINDSQFEVFCRVVERPELVADTRFGTCAQRAANRQELIAILSPVFKERTTEEWCRRLANTKLPYGPLNTLKEVFEDPHVKAIGIVQEVTHPTAGPMKVLGSSVTFSHFSGDVKSSPLLGQHTEEVLKTILEYSDEKIDELKSKKIIK